MKPGLKNSFSTLSTFNHNGRAYRYHSLPALADHTGKDLSRLPYSLRILLENLLRQEDGDIVRESDIEALMNCASARETKEGFGHEIQFMPARVLLQDFTGVPVIADLAALRAAMMSRGSDSPSRINPVQPVDLIIDHSVQVDSFGTAEAYDTNSRLEYARNRERYEFLKWGQQAFKNFRVVPPATGICHQVNLEFIAQVAMRSERPDGEAWIHPDTLVGTDSHTPMVNGIGVLGWGVGGIEAEAAMLGQPCSMLIPEVIGVDLRGALKPGITATDLVLTITQLLRRYGVVGRFVEFTGPGVASLMIPDRATISNMAPEYGATVGYWPVDQKTIDYLNLTGRHTAARLAEDYFKSQGLWHDGSAGKIDFSDKIELDLESIEPSIAGPSKPHDRHRLSETKETLDLSSDISSREPRSSTTHAGSPDKIQDGSIVIAAITSCTNTSNPRLMIAAGLLARNAVRRGLKKAPWVKTSFAPGSMAVTAYLKDPRNPELMESLEALGFYLVGYGCTTCIGNSGPLPPEIAKRIEDEDLTVASVLSGNRNFEARIHPLVKANYLVSPPLVVAYAIRGRIDFDITREPLGADASGTPLYLSDIWPSADEIEAAVTRSVTADVFAKCYGDVFNGGAEWNATPVKGGLAYVWDSRSTYIQRPPFLDSELCRCPKTISQARILGMFGDFITTDHISPAGSIKADSPAGIYLSNLGVKPGEFNSYGSRRGNHEVMVRGTFANIRLRNQLSSKEGGFTRHWPEGREMTIYDAAMVYQKDAVPLVVVAGRDYGSGSSRDWAAKGTRLLGVSAVIAQSFERIHRSNLVGMGVLPLEFAPGENAEALGLDGSEMLTIENLDDLKPKGHLTIRIESSAAKQTLSRTIRVLVRIDTANELRYYRAGGILPYVLSRMQ